MFLINEKLERIKEISNVNNAVFGSFKDFYADGILIYNAYKNVPGSRGKKFYGALNDKGDKIISESENRIYKENPVFYISYSETEKDEEGVRKILLLIKMAKKQIQKIK